MSDGKLPQAGHLVVLGQTRLGKTAFVRSWLKASSRQAYPRVVVADKAAEYGLVAVGVDDLLTMTEYVQQVGGPPWRVAYQGDDLDEVVPVLCDAAYTIGDSLFVAEEADLWCAPSKILPEMAQLIKYGGKRGAWICSVARRASELHRLNTSQARHVIAFGAVEPLDVDYLRKAVSADYAATVAGLDPLEGAWWDRNERALVRLRVDPAALRIHRLDKEEPPGVA